MERTWIGRLGATLTTLMLISAMSTAFAEKAEQFHAGIARMAVPADVAFDTLVWYPTQAEEVPWHAGPFLMPASRDAAIAPGVYPVVLLSHGGGVSGGSPLILRELSAALARQGFVVVAPFHGKADLADRSRQISQALDAVLANPRFKPHTDQRRLGMLGFSLGGAVTLELAGAVPNEAHLVSYCDAHPTDTMSCDDAPGGGGRGTAPSRRNPLMDEAPSQPKVPLKAIVLLDPFAVLYQRDDLSVVTMPVMIFRPDESALPGEANAIGLAAALPRGPQYQTLPGGHFIFADVCEPVLLSLAPETCRDPPGVRRTAIHVDIETRIAAFFHDNL